MKIWFALHGRFHDRYYVDLNFFFFKRQDIFILELNYQIIIQIIENHIRMRGVGTGGEDFTTGYVKDEL